jgi:hypothetical protein
MKEIVVSNDVKEAGISCEHTRRFRLLILDNSCATVTVSKICSHLLLHKIKFICYCFEIEVKA